MAIEGIYQEVGTDLMSLQHFKVLCAVMFIYSDV